MLIRSAQRSDAVGARPAMPSQSDNRYAVFFSPGQHFPMGGWVLRTDRHVDVGRMEEACRRLVDRHAALRAQVVEPLRLLSYCLDTAILLTLVARAMDQGSRMLRTAHCLLSWALKAAWPRLLVRDREEVYRTMTAKVPFEVVRVESQISFETQARQRRTILTELPLDIALVQIEVQLVGLWVYGQFGGQGDFVILPQPSSARGSANASECGLVFCDRVSKDVGVLVGPRDVRWRPPPAGFPALLCARLLPSGAVVWLRVLKKHELAVLWKPNQGARTRWNRSVAFRMPSAHCSAITSVFSYLVVHAMHSVADGQSYEAIVGDLLAFYGSMTQEEDPHNIAGNAALPPLANGLAELQRRLFGALSGTEPVVFPQRCSLRGGMFRFRGRGYGHRVFLQGAAGIALRQLAVRYGAPPDIVVLALSAASIARASGHDAVVLTLYVPVRDGPGEQSLVGLFSDWRDLEVAIDPPTATVLGTVLEVADAVRERRWAIFNALRKPEAIMVNFQMLDFASTSRRAGFVQVGEDAWRQGERLNKSDTRSDTAQQIPQPLTLNIEQQERDSWCLHLQMAEEVHPPAWTRRFVRSFDDAFQALLTSPTELVHRSFPANFY